MLTLDFISSFAQILFRKYGWDKDLYNQPKYRSHTKAYDFDDYASKGSAVHHTKKYNRNLEAQGEMQQLPPAEPGVVIESK